MLGLLLALQAILVAGESARHAESSLRISTSSPATLTALALVDTHNIALARIRSGAEASAALRGSRRVGTDIRICSDATRMLTAFGPTSETVAPDYRRAFWEAFHPKVRHGYSGADGSVPATALPAGCSVPPGHVWIGTSLN